MKLIIHRVLVCFFALTAVSCYKIVQNDKEYVIASEFEPAYFDNITEILDVSESEGYDLFTFTVTNDNLASVSVPRLGEIANGKSSIYLGLNFSNWEYRLTNDYIFGLDLLFFYKNSNIFNINTNIVQRGAYKKISFDNWEYLNFEYFFPSNLVEYKGFIAVKINVNLYSVQNKFTNFYPSILGLKLLRPKFLKKKGVI